MMERVGRAFAELVSIGRIDRPQGLRGEVIVTPFSDRPDRFPSLVQAFVPDAGGGSRALEVASCRPHKGRFVIKFAGIDSIDAAEAYRGFELRIGEEQLPELPEGAYYDHELRGLEARAVDGSRLGTVRDVLDAGAAPVLVIDGPEGELLVPLAEPFLRAVDIQAGHIELVRPEWMEGDAEH
jgi:16S rRNA processing protein RimM